MNKPPSAQPQAQSATGGHETRDAKAGWIFGVILLLFIIGLALHFVLAGIMKLFQNPKPGATEPPRLTAAKTPPRFPPLQVSPPVDLNNFRIRENAQLQSYGWINRTGGVVRIPISQAMDLLLQKGLPTRDQSNALGPSSWQLQQQRASKSTNR